MTLPVPVPVGSIRRNIRQLNGVTPPPSKNSGPSWSFLAISKQNHWHQNLTWNTFFSTILYKNQRSFFLNLPGGSVVTFFFKFCPRFHVIVSLLYHHTKASCLLNLTICAVPWSYHGFLAALRSFTPENKRLEPENHPWKKRKHSWSKSFIFWVQHASFRGVYSHRQNYRKK